MKTEKEKQKVKGKKKKKRRALTFFFEARTLHTKIKLSFWRLCRDCYPNKKNKTKKQNKFFIYGKHVPRIAKLLLSNCCTRKKKKKKMKTIQPCLVDTKNIPPKGRVLIDNKTIITRRDHYNISLLLDSVTVTEFTSTLLSTTTITN